MNPAMRSLIICAALCALAPLDLSFAQTTNPSDVRIVWEVKNRFRLFRHEADFQRQVTESRADGILATEQKLEKDTAGLGWAKDVVNGLCVDLAGNLMQTCERDGVSENYLAPRDHVVGIKLAGTVPQGVICVWGFTDGDGAPRQRSAGCNEEIKLRVRYGTATAASIDVPQADGSMQHLSMDIAVRDVLIAGLGDSIAAGEGNPDIAVQLEGGFCFNRFGGGGQYFRPSRAGYTGDRSCENMVPNASAATEWARHGARWMNPACHRSLYSYQVRTALALAVEQTHLAVTFIPLACTGATIDAGMFNSQRSDDCPWVVGIETCSGRSPPQLSLLRDLIAAAHRQQPQRALDLILLTIGANDSSFAALVANVIVNSAAERLLLRQGGGMASPAEAQRALDEYLPDQFARLRAALKPFVGNLTRVVYVSYGNPAMQAENKPCAGGRYGLDVHPAFSADKERLRAAAQFVDTKFLPALKSLATCESGKSCRDPSTDRMTFVDAHQPAFAQHGMCVRAADDPQFDRDCFSVKGDSFETDLAAAADEPMACNMSAGDYRPYAPRGRWIRSVNDSYFTAMTYPEGMPAILKPTDIHDALWGVVSAVYGGALHPTAEGYAAMADAALPAARAVLGVSSPPSIRAEPLPAPADAPAPDTPLPRTP
jgi:hypothetical protein